MSKLSFMNLPMDICGHGFLWRYVMLSLAQINNGIGSCCWQRDELRLEPHGEEVPRTLLGMEISRLWGLVRTHHT